MNAFSRYFIGHLLCAGLFLAAEAAAVNKVAEVPACPELRG